VKRIDIVAEAERRSQGKSVDGELLYLGRRQQVAAPREGRGRGGVGGSHRRCVEGGTSRGYHRGE
jgi:hypothetical protein